MSSYVRNKRRRIVASVVEIAAIASTLAVADRTMTSLPVFAEGPFPSATPTEIFETVCPAAGTGRPFDADPDVVDFPLNQPTKITSDDAGNVFVYDSGNQVVRRYAADATRTMTIVAGGGSESSDSLPATQNDLVLVADIEVTADGSTLYIAEWNALRRVDVATGDITTIGGIRGSASLPVPTDGTPAAGASFGNVVALAVSDTRLYVMSHYFELEPVSSRIFSVDLGGSNLVKTVVGGATQISGINEASTSMLSGVSPATDLWFASGLEMELGPNQERLYFISQYGRMLDYDIATDTVTRIAGSAATLGRTETDGVRDNIDVPPSVGLAFRNSRMIVAQTEGNRLRAFELDNYMMSPFLGSGVAGSNTAEGIRPIADGSTEFASPFDITEDAAGNLYVADTFNHRVQLISNDGGSVAGEVRTITPPPPVFVQNTDSRPALELHLQNMSGLAADDAGGYYIADNASNRIWYVDANGIAHHFAGTGRHRLIGDPWVNGEAALSHSFGAGNNSTGYMGQLRFVNVGGQRFLYVAEGWDPGNSTRLVRIAIDQPGRPVTSVVGNGGLTNEFDIGQPAVESGGLFSTYAVDSNGDVYLGDITVAHIVRIDGASGVLELWAGSATEPYDYEVTANGGNRLAEKVGYLAAIDVDVNGVVYFSNYVQDRGLTRIFRVGADDLVVHVAGSADAPDLDSPDGAPALDAGMQTTDIRVDADGQIYTKESFILRRVDPVTGALHRVTGPFSGVPDAADHSLSGTPLPRLSAANNTITEFDLANDGTVLLAEDYRPSGDLGLAQNMPLGGTNRVRRVVPGDSCDRSTPLPAHNVGSVIRVDSDAWLPGGGGGVSSMAATPELRYVVYTADVRDGDGGRPATTDVYVYDRFNGTTDVANLAFDGQPDPAGVPLVPLVDGTMGSMASVAVRADGNVMVAFQTRGRLLPVDVDEFADIYLKNMTTGSLSLVSASQLGGPIDGGDVLWPDLSDDGSQVVFSYLNRLWVKDVSVGGSAALDVYDTPDLSELTGRFSDDGRWLVSDFFENGGSFGRWNLASGEFEFLSSGRLFAVDGDGSRYLMSNGGGIEVLDVGFDAVDIDLPTDFEGVAGRPSDISADGRWMVIDQFLDEGVRQQWLVDLDASPMAWTPLHDGATLRSQTPESIFAAVDNAGRRVAFMTENQFPELDAPIGRNVYLRDTRPLDTSPSLGAGRGLAAGALATDVADVEVAVDGSVVFWRDGELWRLTPDGDVVQLTAGAAGPHPFTVGPTDALWFDQPTGLVRRVQFDNPLAPVTVFDAGVGGMTDLAYGDDDGGLYFSRDEMIFVYFEPNDDIRLVVGIEAQSVCNGGENQVGSNTPLCGPRQIDIAADGTVYFIDRADTGCGGVCARVRRIDDVGLPTQRVVTIGGMAGASVASVGATEDGVDARTTPMGALVDLAVGADGSVYTTEELSDGSWVVRRIAPNGVLSTVVGAESGAPNVSLPRRALDRTQSSLDAVAATPNGQLVFASADYGQLVGTVGIDVQLSAANALVNGQVVLPPGVSVVPTGALSADTIEPSPSPVPSAEQAVEEVDIGDVDLDDPLDGTLEASPLRSVPLRSVPLRSVELSSVPLRSVMISSTPLDIPGGWATVLAGTPLADRPLHMISLDDVLNPALNTNLGSGGPADLNEVPFGALDLSATPLRSVPLAAVALGSTPLRSVPLPTTVPGATVLDQWCSLVAINGLNCLTDFGINPAVPSSGDGVTLLSITLAGIPLRSVPLRSVPLRSVDLSASPLRSVPLRSVDLSASPLRSVPLRSVVLASTPLRSVPLRSVPLRSVDLLASPLRSVPLRSVVGANVLFDCSQVDCTATSSATLGTAADVDPTAIRETATVGALVDALPPDALEGFTLGDLRAYGNATIGDLIDALPLDAEFTFGDLLRALIPLEDYPWEQLDIDNTSQLYAAALGSATLQPGQVPVRYLADYDVDAALPVMVDGAATTPMRLETSVDVQLPSGYGYLPGTAQLEADGTLTKLPDPQVVFVGGDTPVLRFDAGNLRDTGSIQVQAVPGLELGQGSTAVRFTGVQIPATDVAALNTSVDGEWEEDNNTVATARLINPDTIYFGHLASSADIDMYRITVSEGQSMSAILSNLPADFDLTLYAPPVPALANRDSERVLVPVQDEVGGILADAAAAPANPADDLPLADELVYAVGQRRDTGDERIDTGRLRAGTYYLQVSGFNGAASTKPYALRVTTVDGDGALPPCATWTFVGDALQRGSLPAASAYAGANTLLVVNRERLFGKYPADAPAVIAALEEFVTATNADAALGVRAVVLPIDGDASVRAAYQTWEAGTNRCDPLAARDVASATAGLLDSVLAANPNIANVVIVGGDDIVPFGRVPDTTTLANEREFAQELDGNNELVASLRGGWLLTDDVYVDQSPVLVGPAELYVPNVALGRLVESPGEIISALDDFVDFDGHLDASTALSVGYDFLTDGSNAVKNALTNNGFTTDANANALIGDTWSADDLKAALLGEGAFDVPDIASVNAHYDDYRALPANENTNLLPTNLFTTDDLPATRTLARSLLFSVGCHGGYNVADSTQADRPGDWAQGYAQQGAIWIGNTGFGYGDTEVVAASEKLMAEFAELLNGQYTTGQALLLAKQRYVADLGEVVTSYDIKVSQQMTFYGLPMYRLQATSIPPAAAPAPPALTTDVLTGLDVAPLSIVTPIDDSAPFDPGTLQQTISERGTYYTVDGDALTVQNRPVQPRVTRDITRVSSSSGATLSVATGMLITELTSVDIGGINPMVYRPIVDSSQEAEPATVENLFPAAPVSIGESTDLVTIAGQTRSIARQQVVAIPGQFRADPSSAAGLGVQRLFPEMNGIVHYASPGVSDRAAPSVRYADAIISGTSVSFTVRADDDGNVGGVRRVYVLTIPSNPGSAPVQWTGIDLTEGTPGLWTGGVTLPDNTTGVDFLVQVVDSVGNVGVSSNKGTLFRSELQPLAAPEAPQLSLSPAIGASGWLAGSATVTAVDPGGLAMSYTIDAGPTQPYTGPVTVAGSGAHVVQVRNTAGKSSVLHVPIDAEGPSVVCSAPPAAWSGTDVSVSCVAVDDGAGLASGASALFMLSTIVADDSETVNASTATRQVCDALGQCTTAGPITGLRVDRKAPVITVTSPTQGASIPQGAVLDASFGCADGGSGVASCVGSVANGGVIDTSTPGPQTFTVTATDAVGNVASRSVSYTVTDASPPTIICSPVPSTWSATNVTITCTASDASGLANVADASFELSTTVAAGSETANASTAGRTVCDTQGNCATAGPFAGIKVDRRAPAITLTAPTNGATYALGQVVLAAFSCNEGGSGEVGCTGTVAVGAAIDTATTGSKTFTVTSTDAVGNSATTTVTYNVVSTNSAPVVRADMGVVGLQQVGYQTGAVLLRGSFTDADGSGPYTASVRWSAGGPFTPLILNNSSQFVAAWLYATPGARTVTVRICDAGGMCGTDDVTVRAFVPERITTQRCVVDLGAAANPRYRARYGYTNPAAYPIYVPYLPTIENTFTTKPNFRGQPQLFMPGTVNNAFSVAFSTGTHTWWVNGTSAAASSASPRC